MTVKERLLALKMMEKKKKYPDFFETIKVDVMIVNNQCVKEIKKD